jgi:cell wall-associated NlpC family hydrolase
VKVPRVLLRGLAIGVAVAVLGAAGAASLTGRDRPHAPDEAAARVIAAARTHVGDEYVWGGTGPDRWDCSGLIQALWGGAGGVDGIPRTSQEQAAWAVPIADEDALPGDLVFFDDPVTHVALYLGGGRIIDASSARRGVVLREVWSAAVVRYGRVPRPGMSGGGADAAPVTAARTSPLSANVRIRLNAVPRLGSVSRRRPSPSALRMARAARKVVGAPYASRGRGPAYDAAGLVAASWLRAGGGRLPATPRALERLTRRVRVRDAAPGDLVFYGKPAVHVGIYVGAGKMVDASRALHTVVLRPVFRSETVRIARLVPHSKRVATKAKRTRPHKVTRKPATPRRPTTARKPVAKPARPAASGARKPPRTAPREAKVPTRRTPRPKGK